PSHGGPPFQWARVGRFHDTTPPAPAQDACIGGRTVVKRGSIVSCVEREDPPMGIRMATAADTAALLAIYGQYIDTSITFEYTLPTEAEFAARITGILEIYPYLVWEEDGQILGYAYAHRHM